MSRFAPIDLSQLPPPQVVETLDFETILAALKADLTDPTSAHYAPDLVTALTLESEPVVKLLEVCAYRETLLRARVNDAAQAVMLAKALGADLDHLAAFFGLQRRVLQVANPTAAPPIPEILESDAALRARTQAAPEGYSVAGPVGAYAFWTQSASARVKAAGVTSPYPGHVRITVMSTDGDGTADADLLAEVAAALNALEVRPLCDGVVVRSVAIEPYAVDATLTFYDGPDKAQVLAAARAAVQAEIAAQHLPGRDVTRAGLIAALRQAGVYDVALTLPATNVVVDAFTAPYCPAASITLRDGGTNL